MYTLAKTRRIKLPRSAYDGDWGWLILAAELVEKGVEVVVAHLGRCGLARCVALRDLLGLTIEGIWHMIKYQNTSAGMDGEKVANRHSWGASAARAAPVPRAAR